MTDQKPDDQKPDGQNPGEQKTDEQKAFTAHVSLAILKTEGVLQKYISYVLGIDEMILWPNGITPQSPTRFQIGNKVYSLTLEMCEEKYVFNPPYNSKTIREAMATIINDATQIYAGLLNSLGEICGNKLDHLRGSMLAANDVTSLGIYTPVEAYSEKIWRLPKRIGFYMREDADV